MKKFKNIFIVLVLLFLSGCTINSDVIMDYSGKINEKVTFFVNTDNRTEDEINNYFNNVIKNYSFGLNARNYSSNVKYDKDISKIEITNKYNNICEYFQKTIFSQYLYEHISCIETDKYFEIKNETSHIDYCYDCLSWPPLNDVKFTIKLPIKATENNADYVKDNVYTWEFDENTSSDKGIYLKINKNSLEENKILAEKKEKTKTIFSKVIYIFVAIIVLGVIVLIINGLYKKYKENNLEY